MGKVDMQWSEAILLSVAFSAAVVGLVFFTPSAVAASSCVVLVVLFAVAPLLSEKLQTRFANMISDAKVLLASMIVMLSVRWAYASVGEGRQDLVVRSDPAIDWVVAQQPEVLVISAAILAYMKFVADWMRDRYNTLRWLYLSH